MIDFKTYIKEQELLDEAGNVSSSMAIRKHNDVLKYGKDVIRSKSIKDKLDSIAKQNVCVGSLALMSIAVSGGDSFTSSIAKLMTTRKI